MKFDKKYFTIITNGYSYDILAKELNTSKGLESWLFHLTEMCWFDMNMAHQMVSMCEAKFNYTFNGAFKRLGGNK